MITERGKSLPRITNYITPEGDRRLRGELNHLWRIERPLVTQQVSDAAALGDRSENAEYIYGKKRLREIDRRVRYLRKRLEVLKIVHSAPSDRSRVYFGAWVQVEDEEDVEHEYRLVGPDEIGVHPSYISVDAPLGRALLGKSVGHEVEIMTPGGKRYWHLLTIRYGEN